MRVLHIEDDDIDALAVQRAAARVPGVVIDRKKILNGFDWTEYDAAIVDLSVPDASATEVMGRAVASGIPIVVYSGIEDDEVRAFAESQGFLYVHKSSWDGKRGMSLESMVSVVRSLANMWRIHRGSCRA